MSSLTRLPLIAELFSQSAIAMIGAPAADWTQLYPEEQAQISQAVEKRRMEFAAGRVAARQALAKLGVASQPILIGMRRAPEWPAGVTGSISHSTKLCTVAVGRTADVTALGIDTEPDTPLEPELWSAVARPDELRWLASQMDNRQGKLAKVLFCVKESIYKAIAPSARTFIGFDDVETTIDVASGRFQAHLLRDFSGWVGGDRLSGRFIELQGNIIAGTEVRLAK